MDTKKIEDAIFKESMDVFKESAISFFGIDVKIIAPALTEIKDIVINTSFTDYTFYTSDNSILHFEFQTTKKKKDIQRFMFYDASLNYSQDKMIRTIVVYSSEIENAPSKYDAGSIKYEVENFYMKNLDGDKKFEEVKIKVEAGQSLNENDMLNLTFVPLMTSSRSRVDRAIDSIRLANEIDNTEIKKATLSILYAFVDKFADKNSKNKIMEEFSMTEIGRMLYEKGIKEGEETGEKKGKAELLLIQLTKKFKKVPEEYSEKIKILPDKTIELIGADIFEIEDIKDIEKYF